ncbi:GNAT family N-acetyltransferase [Sphingomonas sp. LHG3406-1]|uniref:GNAT family N-acetyltransferase n=1 Tax=Sphingomonas sp. LHG3406-1 TaxID=2804617 RepID=UPI00261BFEBB|nr:GNAT family N-acetyltransferase [Sphingomonas sp. LHG3406-1]
MDGALGVTDIGREYAIEALTPDTFDELAPIMLDAFGDQVDTGYFRWKYVANPSGPAIGNIARTSQGEVAAFYGMIPETYRTPSGPRKIYQSCDTMTHSGHRRRGLFQRLALATYADAQRSDPGFFAFGFGGPTSTPGFLKMGWKIAFYVPFLFEPWPVSWIKAGRQRSFEAESSDLRLHQLVAAADQVSDRGILRSPEFVIWRLANPLRRYRILLSDEAYAIVLDGPHFTFVFDFWEASPGAGRDLLAELRASVKKRRGKGLLTFCQRGSSLHKLLARHGFLRNPFSKGPASDKLPLITYGQCPWKDEERGWSITPFDHDSY